MKTLQEICNDILGSEALKKAFADAVKGERTS